MKTAVRQLTASAQLFTGSTDALLTSATPQRPLPHCRLLLFYAEILKRQQRKFRQREI